MVSAYIAYNQARDGGATGGSRYKVFDRTETGFRMISPSVLRRGLAIVLILFVSCATAPAGPTTAPSADFRHTWLLHLPGIGGEMPIDHALIDGLIDGGWEGPTTIYDWTEKDPGLDALRNHRRNAREATKVAKMIEDRVRQDPKTCIMLTSHSGGTGIAVWALEQLPEDVRVQDLFLLASALSPRYDLTAALKHVRGRTYVFYSASDALVLGTGTKLFGTIDGVRCEAAGLVGFTPPKKADKRQYAKLVQKPYEKGWAVYGHFGTHIGCMSAPFAKNIVAPIVIEDLAASEVHENVNKESSAQGKSHEAAQ